MCLWSCRQGYTRSTRVCLNGFWMHADMHANKIRECGLVASVSVHRCAVFDWSLETGMSAWWPQNDVTSVGQTDQNDMHTCVSCFILEVRDVMTCTNAHVFELWWNFQCICQVGWGGGDVHSASIRLPQGAGTHACKLWCGMHTCMMHTFMDGCIRHSCMRGMIHAFMYSCMMHTFKYLAFVHEGYDACIHMLMCFGCMATHTYAHMFWLHSLI